MRLLLELTPDDVRRLRRTARQRPTGGFTDMAVVILAATTFRADRTAVAELRGYEHIERFCRQAWRGAGGWQSLLRHLALRLETDTGESYGEWVDVLAVVADVDLEHGGEQLELLAALVVPMFTDANECLRRGGISECQRTFAASDRTRRQRRNS